MMAAFARGLKPGVDGCLSARVTYDHFYFIFSEMVLALLAFAFEPAEAPKVSKAMPNEVYGNPSLPELGSFYEIQLLQQCDPP